MQNSAGDFQQDEYSTTWKHKTQGPLTLLLSGNYIPEPEISYSFFVPATTSRASQKAAHFHRFDFSSQPCLLCDSGHQEGFTAALLKS